MCFCNCRTTTFSSGKLLASLNYFAVFDSHLIVKEWPHDGLRKINVFFFTLNKFCENITE